MSQFITSLNSVSTAWFNLAVAVLWQSAALFGIAALVAFALRRYAPAVRYWVWQVVAIKLLLMPFWVVWVPLPAVFSASNTLRLAAATDDPASAGAKINSPSQSANVPAYSPGLLSEQETHLEAGLLPTFTWSVWMLVIWFAVVCAQVLRVAYQRYGLARLLEKARVLEDQSIATLLNDLARQLGLCRAPTALVTACDCSPFVFGIWRPTIVLPQGLLSTITHSDLRQVLLHELAHVRRHDLIWGWLPEIARVIYWFHPIAHWVSYRIQLERELACDKIAMALSNQNAAGYAATLVRVVSHVSGHPFLIGATVSTELDGVGHGTTYR